MPYKNNSIRGLWDWIQNTANGGNMVFGPPYGNVTKALQRGIFFHKRASVSKFYFGCFQNATGSSSAPSKAPELRIELAVMIFHARGPEIA